MGVTVCHSLSIAGNDNGHNFQEFRTVILFKPRLVAFKMGASMER